MNRHTFNANSEMLGDHELFFWTLNHWRPDRVFMMGSENGPNHQVHRAKDLSASWGGRVHYRPYSGHEGHLWRTRKPLDHINLIKGFHQPDITYHIGNEPIPKQDEARLMSLWYAEFFRIAKQEGLKVAGPGFATGAYERSELGWFDEMFISLAQNGAILDVHTYGHALFPWHCAGRDPRDLIHPDRVQRDRWPTKAEILSNLDVNYLVMREEQIVDLIRRLTGITPEVFLGECFLDRMPNIEVQLRDITERIDTFAGQKIYGVPTLYNYWRHLFPQWTAEQTLFEQMNWAEEVYPEYYKAFSWFTWSSHDDHPHYWSSRYGWQHNRKILEDWPKARKVSVNVPVEITPSDGSPILGTAKFERNYRNDTVVSTSTLIGTFPANTVMVIYPESRVEKNAYVWIKIQIGATVAWTSLAAGLYPELDAYDNPPPPPPPPAEGTDLEGYVRKDELPELVALYLRGVFG